MSDRSEHERVRILAIEDQRKTFFTDVDGFVKWWPDTRGYLCAHHLRWIADELDRRNKGWQAEIDRDLGLPDSAHAQQNSTKE